MPYQWSTINVPLAVGVETRGDEKLVSLNRLLDLQNAVFEPGRLLKRNGYEELEALSGVKALAVRENELVAMDGAQLHSYSETLSQWIEKGDLLSFGLEVETIADTTAAQTVADCAETGGLRVFAWEDSRGGVWYAAYDVATDSEVLAQKQLSATAQTPRVVVIGDTIHIVYHDTTTLDIRSKRLVPADLATSDALTPYQFGFYDVHASGGLDVVATDGAALWVYRTNSSNLLRIGWLTQTGALGGPGSGLSAPLLDQGASTGVFSINYSPDDDTVCLCLWRASAVVLRARFFTDTDTAFNLTATQDFSTTEPVRVTCVPDSDGDFHVFAEVAGAETYLDRVLYAVVNAAGVVTAETTLMRHAGLGSHAFTVGDDVLVHLVHDSTFQSTYFLVNTDGNPVGRVVPGESNGRPTRAHLPRVSSPEDGIYHWAAAFKHRLKSITPTATPVYAQPGIKYVRYDFEDTAALSWVERGGCLYIGGGIVYQYDRSEVAEAGFLLYSENVSGVAGTTGDLTSSTSVSYRVYPEHYNALGQRVMGTTAAVVTVELGDNQDSVTLTIPTLAMTWKTAVGFAVYRTKGDGTAYQRVSSLDPTTAGDTNGWVANDPTVDTVTFVDEMSDEDLATKEPDYRNGLLLNEVDNVAPQTMRGLRVVQGRVWGISQENPRRVFFSKESVEKHAVEWFDGFYIDVPVDITAIGVIQGMPVLFGRESIYVTEGEGPDNLNSNGAYGEPELLPADVGVDEPRSLVEAPAGLMFKSRKGVRLLNRQFQVSYVGSDVAGYNDADFTAASAVLDANHVRFLADDRALVFDWEKQEWTTWTRHAGVSSVVWRGRYVFAKSDGTIRVEDPTTFMEGNNAVALGLTTSWIKTTGTGPQGYGLLDKYVLYGKYKTNHRLRIEIGYDYEDHFRQNYVIDPADFIETSTWGSDATWGDSTVWGGSGRTNVYRIRRQFKFRKASAVRFRITEIPGDDAGEGLELTGLVIKVADLGGLTRLPESRSS